VRFWRVLGVVVGAVVLLGLILVGNTLRKGSRQVAVEPLPVQVDVAVAVATLSSAIQLRTVADGQRPVDPAALAALRDLLQERFPRAHAALERREMPGGTLWFTWRGRDPAAAPGLLLAHQDVVPVGDASRWAHPPFSGAQVDGFIWGRGAMDDKQNIVAQLTAVEILLAQGFQPRQTLHLVFGHDEETGGSGARSVAAAMRADGVTLDFVLDEGGLVSDGVLDGLPKPAALVGVSEKGYASLRLRVRAEGGHSSMPPPHSAVGRLAQAIVAIEERPLPARLDGPTWLMFDTIGPEMVFGQRLVMANRWLLEPVLVSILSGKPSANATLRTTQAVTMASGSSKDNVLPEVADAVVNFRLVPGDTTESVIAHVRAIVGDDVEVSVLEGTIASDPSPVARADGPAWDALQASIRQTWPDAAVSPFLFIGATDARFFTERSERVWRFAPMKLNSDDLKRLHGSDERLSVENLEFAIGFYVRFMSQVAR
jgi:carboxypeptidase PM20D1